jgi:hypothetical protein
MAPQPIIAAFIIIDVLSCSGVGAGDASTGETANELDLK